jgi:hypothetical protein
MTALRAAFLLGPSLLAALAEGATTVPEQPQIDTGPMKDVLT